MDIAALIEEKLKPFLQQLNSLNDKVSDLQRRVGLLEGILDNQNTPSSTILPSKKCDIFVSFHVTTTEQYARSLKKYLETAFGCSVFLCTDMVAGISYREQIVDGIESCVVFIPIINKEWAESAECADEFNHGRRTNLISHKTGKTKPPQPRLPIILPVYFKEFDFMQYKDIRLLASSINFQPLNVNNLEDGWKALQSSILYLNGNLKSPKLNPSGNVDHGLHKDLMEALSAFQNDASNDLGAGGGTFILTGKTVNDYDGNTTYTDRCLLTFTGGRVSGSIDYKPGTLYNTSDVAPIQGTYDLTSGKTQWTEIYHHGQSHFEYTGKINGNTIMGTYYWREKPTAKGKFDFTLERWL